MSDQQRLDLGLVKVHCCFCPHYVVGADPDDAHHAMEAHYEIKHDLAIDRIVGTRS